MSITAFAGPLLIFGQGASSGTYNPELAPSAVYGASGLYDPRFRYGKGGDLSGSTVAYGFAPSFSAVVIDQAPSTAATANIAALANVVNNTPMTLVSSSGAGITVTTSATLIPQNGNSVPSGSLAIDLVPAIIQYGQTLAYAVADPRTLLARAVSITGVSGGAGGAFLVSGYDLWGNAQTETITAGAGAGTTNGKKAFKFIASVTPKFTDAHNYSVGTADVFGLPLFANAYGYVHATWNNVMLSSPTFVAGDTTSPATASTGDVRGTIVPASSSDGTKKLQVMMGLAAQNVVTSGNTGMFGVTPA